MAKFQGTLWLVDEVSSKLSVEVDIRDEGTVAITARDLAIGEWPRSQLVVEPSSDGIHIIAEGEELVFASETPGFVDAFSGGRPLKPFSVLPTRSLPSDLGHHQPLERLPDRPAKPPTQASAASSPQPGPSPATSPARMRHRRTRVQPRSGKFVSGQPGLALAVVSVVLALGAVALAFWASLSVVAVACGVLAALVGIIATRGKEWWEAPRVKGLATAGIALGIVSISLGVMGMDGVNSVLDSVASDIGGIVDSVGSENGIAQNVVLQLQECSSNGATGLVTNGENMAVDVLIGASFFDETGRQVAAGTAVLNEVGPNSQSAWQVTSGGTDYAHCRAEIQHAAPS
ncbi:MAG TPA: DUF4190 domain-containing protein [Acidimicrobiia bacterium]|nr:DUF4190 domain-containing protein [Acidimicrobiia bacterium]